MAFLGDDGEMASRIRSYDWTGTLGSPASWPLSLKTLVGLMLSSTQPMFLAWGDRRTWLYNDAFIPILGQKHPQALGCPALDEVWHEARDALTPLFDKVFSGEPVHMEDFAIMLNRGGGMEEAHFTYSYTPVRDDSGHVAGLFGVCVEITDRARVEQQRTADLERQRRQFEQAPGFIIVMRGPDHVVEFVNNAHRKLFASQHWVGKGIRAAFSGLADRKFFEELDRVYATGHIFDVRGAAVRFRRSAASAEETRYLDFIYSPILSEHGEITGIFCEGFDVTAARKSQESLRVKQKQLRHLNETLAASEQALKERENELARVQSIAKVGGVTVDLRQGFFRNRRSPEYLAIHGLPPTSANEAHEDWVQRIHPEDRVRAEQEFLKAIADGSDRYSSEYRIVRPNDGEVRWIAAEAQIERGPDGEPLRLIGAHIDITERVVAKGRLRESEERFRLIANSAPVPMWVSRMDGTRAFANLAYLEFLGLPYEKALVFDWRKILHADDLPRILQEQIAGEASLQPFVLEARYRRADGLWRWMRSESQPRLDPTGKHIGFIGVAHDITAAKQAEMELRDRNQSLSAQVVRRTRERDRLWNVSQDLLVVLDQQGSWLSTNPAWLSALGWSDVELVSSHSSVKPPALGQACNELTRLLLADQRSRFDLQFPHRDGTARWISWTSSMDSNAVYGVGRDVTAEREAQETLRITEEALRQSQKLEAMGQLTGGVAHDFNNLLMPIIGGLDMLQRRGVGGEREQRLIGGALQSADRAKILVQRLLAFARRQPLQPVAVDVGALVAGMGQLVESTTGPQIQVVIDIADNISPAVADPNQLEMAILNLSVNARDAMTEGGTLRISASGETIHAGHRSNLRPGSYVRISVADTGTGMDEITATRAIEPFFSTKGIGKGTGLGLSMVHGLTTQLGGALLISSRPQLGTNVELWLPVSDLLISASSSASDAAPIGKAAGIVLLVDDDDMVRMSTADMLAELGFRVVEAASAIEALQIVDAGQHLDLLITDHLMPGMTGVDLANALRVRRPATPALLVSGFAEADGIPLDLPRLTKPFRQAELAAIMSTMLPSN